MNYQIYRQNEQCVFEFTDHFGELKKISINACETDKVMVSGTAITDVEEYQAVLLSDSGKFRAFTANGNNFVGDGILAGYNNKSGRFDCFVTEYYDLEDKKKWIISSSKIENKNLIFINLEVFDKNNTLLRKYIISPYMGTILGVS